MTSVALSRERIFRDEIPRIIRPDIIPTENGFTIAELDSVHEIASNITGNTTFFNLSFVSLTGKAYVFQGGSTQTIEDQLQILGTSSFGIQFQSAIPAQFASIDLLNGGAQNIDFVGVSNVHATDQHLAPTLTNDGGSGNAVGWFGQGGGGGPGTVAPTPVLSSWAMLLLALGLLAVALTSMRRSFE